MCSYNSTVVQPNQYPNLKPSMIPALAAGAWLLLCFGVVLLEGKKKSRQAAPDGFGTESDGAISSIARHNYNTEIQRLSSQAVAKYLATNDDRHLKIYSACVELLKRGCKR